MLMNESDNFYEIIVNLSMLLVSVFQSCAKW